MAQATGLECILNAANTGSPNCPVVFSRIGSLILLPKGKVYTAAQIADGATFLAALQADAANPNKAQRIYPINGIVSVESVGAEATEETSGYGDTRVLLDTKVALNFTLWEGGACLNKNLMKFSKQAGAYTVMFVDQDGTVAGTQVTSGVNAGGITGYDLNKLYVAPRSVVTGDAGEAQVIQIGLANGYAQWGINWAMIKTNNASTDLKGLNDIQLTNITASITPALPVGSYAIRVTSGCGTQNLVDLYGDVLDTLTQGVIWNSVNATDGGIIPITSITPVTDLNGSQYLIFAFTIANENWVLGENVLLSMVAVDDLNTAGIIGFEANPNSIILPN